MWLVVHSGGDCWRKCSECGCWCMVVVIVGGDVVSVVSGTQWWGLWEVMCWLVAHSGGDCGR